MQTNTRLHLRALRSAVALGPAGLQTGSTLAGARRSSAAQRLFLSQELRGVPP